MQARAASTRLPLKVLLQLPNGRSVLEEVLLRCKAIDGVDVVVCAIPDTSDSDVLLPAILRAGKSGHPVPLTVVRGSQGDVLARYAKAAADADADIILRVTSDCPLISPQVCAATLALVKERYRKGAEIFASNNEPKTFPHGLDCEVFTRALLERANLEATEHSDREHVGPFMRRNAPVKISFTAAEDRSHERITLDTLEDFLVIAPHFQLQLDAA